MARRAGVRTNAAEVAADLERLGRDMQRDALIPGMKSFSSAVAKEARSGRYYTPRSGNLGRSIIAGTPKARGDRVRGSISAGGSKAPYAGALEYGYAGRRSFLRRALTKLAPKYVDHVDAAVAKFIRKRGF